MANYPNLAEVYTGSFQAMGCGGTISLDLYSISVMWCLLCLADRDLFRTLANVYMLHLFKLKTRVLMVSFIG